MKLSKTFLEKYMPQSKDTFNPVFFMEKKDESGLYVVKSSESIPVIDSSSGLVLVPA